MSPSSRISRRRYGLRISGASSSRRAGPAERTSCRFHSARQSRLEVGHGGLGNRTQIAIVDLHVGPFNGVARDSQRRLIQERIDEGGIRVGKQQHVRSLNTFPSGDGGTIEEVAGLEFVRPKRLD